jgi:hypothetical protein
MLVLLLAYVVLLMCLFLYACTFLKSEIVTCVLILVSANQDIHPDENQPQGGRQLWSEAGHVHTVVEGEERS